MITVNFEKVDEAKFLRTATFPDDQTFEEEVVIPDELFLTEKMQTIPNEGEAIRIGEKLADTEIHKQHQNRTQGFGRSLFPRQSFCL